MSTPQDAVPRQGDPREARYSVGGGTVVSTQPSELAYPLRSEQFQIICDGEFATPTERWRDVAIAVMCSALFGLVGLVATFDWARVFSEKKTAPLIWSGLMSIVVVSSLIVTLFLHFQLKTVESHCAYSRLKKRIQEFFAQTVEH
jgi:hypothetical protein